MQKHIELTRQRIARFAAKLPALFYLERCPASLSVYESHGTRGRVRLTSSLDFQSLSLTDLLENELSPLAWSSGAAEFDVSPFQIVTLKLSR